MMEDFAETIEDEELKHALKLGQTLSKPFRKNIIDSSEEYRNKWLNIKKQINKICRETIIDL